MPASPNVASDGVAEASSCPALAGLPKAHFLPSQTHDLSTRWIVGEILRAAVHRPATMRGQPRGGCVQSLILLDFRTVALCAALVATSEAVLAHDAVSQFGTSIVESSWSVGDEPAKDSAVDIPADLWLVPQSLFGALCEPGTAMRVTTSTKFA